MAPTNIDMRHAERLARIEQKLDDFIAAHDGECSAVKINRYWLRGISAIIMALGTAFGVGFLHILDRVNDIRESVAYAMQ